MMAIKAVREVVSRGLVSFQPFKAILLAPVRTANRQHIPQRSALGDWLTQTVAYHH